MPSVLELLSAAARHRLDAIALLIATVAACAVALAVLQRRGAAREFSGKTCAWTIIVVLAGVLLADWATRLSGHPDSAAAPTDLAARALVLGAVALCAAVGLIAAVRLALLRAELRAHAEAGRQLQQAITTADEASRAKSDFLAVMSHEIRTPLNAVMGFANLLAESRLDDAQRGYVSTITNEGARLGALINDILDLTKIEKGRLVIERLPFAPAETAQEVLRLLQPRAADKQLDLRFEAHLAGPLLVAGDPLRFRQVLVNLIDNAIKFTPRGAVTLFMKWTPPGPQETTGRLAVRVRDTGIGISAARLRDIFQMFVQADSSTTRRYGGTGLGLAICQRLVMLMGGDLVARSEQGVGSEFSFTLPYAPLSLPREAPASQPEPDINWTRPPRILVVDDMETNRFLLEVYLRRHGFDPQLAAGGAEAVRLARENDYDAILMDLQMPVMDGFTAARHIRESEPPGRRTLIIALTATIGKGTREKCFEAGMDEHLTKPLDLPRFKSLLNAFLSRRRSQASAGGAACPQAAVSSG